MLRPVAATIAVAFGFLASTGPVIAGDVGWPSYNGNFLSDRFSPLADITPENAADLREVCETSMGDEGAVQAAPVVVKDTLYITTVHTVVAVDATNCALRWRYVYRPADLEAYPSNRGVAYMDDKVFRGTGDGRLVAIDAGTGKEIWRTKIADPAVSEFLSAAPIAWNGLIFLGPAGSDWGIHGRISAFDAATGKEVWRFNTVPQKGEPGFETWHIPETAIHGGGGTWTSYTLDPATGELFVPVANPAPDFEPELRPGDNLYTNAVVVLDAKTGTLKWYYQVGPNDGFDYDLGAAPALFTDEHGHRRVAIGSKDGYLYVVDRDTHKLASKTAVTTVKQAPTAPTAAGVFACPGPAGGVQWNGPAYSPLAHLIYTGTTDWCATYITGPVEYKPPLIYAGTAAEFVAAQSSSGWIYGVNAATGKPAWRYHAESPVVSGATPTAGGVLFSGETAGNLLVFNAKTGKLLLKRDLGGAMGSSISTYSVAGKQYIATTTGNASRTGLGAKGSYMPRVIVMTTGLEPTYKPIKTTAISPGEKSLLGKDQGKSTYIAFCSPCHGAQGEGGESGPSLKNEASRKGFDALVAWIHNPAPPMPKLVPPLSDAEVDAVAHYVEQMK